jgi:hypothetical protein
MTIERRQLLGASLRWMLLCVLLLTSVSASFSRAEAQSAPQGNSVQLDDDVQWPKYREVIFNLSPVLKEVFATDPGIDSEMRAALLPLIKEMIQTPGDTQLRDRVNKTYVDILQKRVTERAMYGASEAINLWGATRLPLYRALAAVSPESCGEYVTIGFTNVNSALVGSLFAAAQQAQLDAFKSSDPLRYALPSRQEVDAAYEQAKKLLQPPFDDNDAIAFRSLEKYTPAEACKLATRFVLGVEQLPAATRAVIYRHWLSESAPRKK